MATHKFSAHRVTALPTPLEPYAVYYVSVANKPEYMEIYVSNSDGSAAKRVLNQADIQALINASIAESNEISIYSDIADRDSDTPTTTKYAYVIDATSDSTVNSGGATYLYNLTDAVWIKTSEAESLDVVLDWANIQNKPTSTVVEIDAAVSKAHTHTNKDELDKVGEDTEGNMTYSGSPVTTQWSTVSW